MFLLPLHFLCPIQCRKHSHYFEMPVILHNLLKEFCNSTSSKSLLYTVEFAEDFYFPPSAKVKIDLWEGLGKVLKPNIKVHCASLLATPQCSCQMGIILNITGRTSELPRLQDRQALRTSGGSFVLRNSVLDFYFSFIVFIRD